MVSWNFTGGGVVLESRPSSREQGWGSRPKRCQRCQHSGGCKAELRCGHRAHVGQLPVAYGCQNYVMDWTHWQVWSMRLTVVGLPVPFLCSHPIKRGDHAEGVYALRFASNKLSLPVPRVSYHPLVHRKPVPDFSSPRIRPCASAWNGVLEHLWTRSPVPCRRKSLITLPRSQSRYLLGWRNFRRRLLGLLPMVLIAISSSPHTSVPSIPLGVSGSSSINTARC